MGTDVYFDDVAVTELGERENLLTSLLIGEQRR
jgi:hypothetical protein